MYFDGEYRQIGTISPVALQKAVAEITEAEWTAFAGRQQAFTVHQATHSIPLIYDPDMRHEDPTRHEALERFGSLLQDAMTAIRNHFEADPPAGTDGSGYFIRVVLVRLAARSTIKSHRDHGYSLARTHRIHLPIITNPAVDFGISGNVRHLPAGELWEVNNRKVHGVRNPSDLSRIHAILDFVIPGETIADPEGELIA